MGGPFEVLGLGQVGEDPGGHLVLAHAERRVLAVLGPGQPMIDRGAKQGHLQDRFQHLGELAHEAGVEGEREAAALLGPGDRAIICCAIWPAAFASAARFSGDR
jgi:hypothetical protein